jgi:hypothetical protein
MNEILSLWPCIIFRSEDMKAESDIKLKLKPFIEVLKNVSYRHYNA